MWFRAYREPAVLADLVLQLAGRPARIAQGHQHLLRSVALAQRVENILGGGEADFTFHHQGGLPFADGLVQDEAAVHLHRPAEINGQIHEIRAMQFELDLFKQGLQGEIDGPIDDHPQRALFVVLTNEGKRLGEVGVRHGGHGDEKVVGEIHSLAAPVMRNCITPRCRWEIRACR